MQSLHSRRRFLGGGAIALIAGSLLPGSGIVKAVRPRAASDPWPRTFEHAFGSTELAEIPERIVTVGLTDHEALLALGVAPVAVTEWFGEQPYATWPWAVEALGDAEPEVLGSAEINFEAIAAHDPDLVLACYAGLEEPDYERLSGIAPTIAQSGDHANWTAPWQEMTRTIARAIGREAEGAELIDAIEQRFRDVREEHPEFVGATGTVVDGPDNGVYGILGPEDPRGRILRALGLEYPDAIADIVPDDSFYGEISAEQIHLLDNEVLVWLSYDPATQNTVEADPLYQSLRAAEEGRTVFLTEVETAAMGYSTVLSIPYVLDTLVPRLAAAVDGDPGTSA